MVPQPDHSLCLPSQLAGMKRASSTYEITDHSPGKQKSTQRYMINEAKPSLSQRWVHHSIVTKLPNHWCASSWPTIKATSCFEATDELAGSISRRASLNDENVDVSRDEGKA